MKIEKVSFDNINSLGGHFELNLTHPSLTDTGLFVITGPTGAGKTTLLDAITYAIYGQTARQKKVTATSNEIMTHGMRFCRAEAIVEKDGRRYLFSTEQRRRKTRTETASVYTTAERRVSRIEADGTLRLLHSDVSGVKQVADSLMKYDNFCRCMMLAQGDFALFLKSDAKTRSEALATITGTEIYQRIGEKVQARVAALKSAIDSVSLLPVMGEDAREAAERCRDEQQERCKSWQADMDNLNKALAWHAALSKAADTRHSCAETCKKAQDALRAFAEAGQPARITSAEAAQRIRPQEVARRAAAGALADRQQQHDTEQAWLLAHPDTEYRAAAQQHAAALAEQQPSLLAQLNFLAEKVQPLEESISKAGVKAKEAARSAATRRREAEDASAAARKEAKGAEDAATAHQQAQTALAQLAGDAALTEALPAILQRLADWQKCPRAAEELPSATELAARVEAEAAERARLLAGRRREELPLRHGKLEALARLSTRKDESGTRAQELAYAKAAADAELAALPSVDEAEAACNAARERAQLAFNIQNMSSKLDELYREFCAGKLTHCPCCGSPEPHTRPAPAADALEEAKRAEKAARKELTARQKAVESAREKRAAAKAACKAAEQAWRQLCKEQADALEELGWQELPTDLAEQTEQLQQHIQRLAQLDVLAAELQSLRKQDACRSALHEALRPCCPELPATLADAEPLVRHLSKRQKAYSKAAGQVDTCTRELAIATERATLARAEADKAAANARTAADNAQQLQQALENRQAELAALWQGGPARRAEETLRATLGNLQQAAQTAKDALNTFTLKRETHSARARAAAEQLPALREQALAAENAFSAALTEHQFADEEAYAAALLPPAELEQLRRRAAELEQARAAAEGALTQAREQENELREQKLSEESPEALAEQKKNLAEVLEEQSELLKTQLAELLKDDDARRLNAEKEAQVADTRRELAQWQLLYEILGNSKDGFKKYAQRITFNLLLTEANQKLRLLTHRYTLVQDEREELGLRVIDRYRDDAAGRSCSNLSGGESFIVSLALALGLSRMTGETRIDTLFLDEGFGTLDEDALEQVLNCLQSLRADGKLIGIISHVDALKERIAANIELLPRGTTGLSSIGAHAAVVAEPV